MTIPLEIVTRKLDTRVSCRCPEMPESSPCMTIVYCNGGFRYTTRMTEHPAIIYRIIGRADWQAAQAAGAFRGTAHDTRDGFIHFSTAAQAAETAARYYAGQDDLLLLYVDTASLTAPLRWEKSRNDELFPHLYGPLPIAAVQHVAPLPLDAAGRHVFPDDMP